VEDELMALSWKNHNGETVSAAVGLAFMDKNIGLILDQLAGPGTRDAKHFPGWGFLGDDTVLEAVGKLSEAVKARRAAVAELVHEKEIEGPRGLRTFGGFSSFSPSVLGYPRVPGYLAAMRQNQIAHPGVMPKL